MLACGIFRFGNISVWVYVGVRLAWGPIENTMTLLQGLQNITLLTPYEHLFIQSLHKAGRLISEQNPYEPNPLLQLAINPYLPPT